MWQQHRNGINRISNLQRHSKRRSRKSFKTVPRTPTSAVTGHTSAFAKRSVCPAQSWIKQEQLRGPYFSCQTPELHLAQGNPLLLQLKGGEASGHGPLLLLAQKSPKSCPMLSLALGQYNRSLESVNQNYLPDAPLLQLGRKPAAGPG